MHCNELRVLKSVKLGEVCTRSGLSGSLQKVYSRALVDWINCGVDSPQHLQTSHKLTAKYLRLQELVRCSLSNQEHTFIMTCQTVKWHPEAYPTLLSILFRKGP